ncbi:MAG: T9SS type A sorting domain-containing protein [Bacteroidetes bacterium]|nr:T9SS type A sorting domain-containing protein [Bacteroidota bacterium]
MIPVNVPRNAVVHFTVSNLLGKQVISRDVNLQKGSNSIPVNLQSLQPGIYLYNISYGGNSVTRRMIVSEN